MLEVPMMAADIFPPLKPLHIFESWHPVVSGYTSRSRALIAAQIHSGDFEPRVLVTSRQGTYGKTSIDSPDGLGDRIRYVCPSSKEIRWRRFRRFYVDSRHLELAIEKMVIDHGADLIHSHWSAGIGRAAANLASRLGLPLVAEVRFDLAGAFMSETVRFPLPGLERALRRHFERHLTQAQAVIAASDSLARFLRAEFPWLGDRLFVVPNGVDLERFRAGPPDPELRARLGLEGSCVIGTTSNMLRYEGLDLLIQGLVEAQRQVPNIQALFVGAGTQAEHLQKLAYQAGVRATFTGLVPAAQVPQYLRLIDLFVIPRRDATITRQASPIKLVEAMACGLAVVGSRLGDIEILLADGRGALVEPESVPALTKALVNLCQQGETRREMGRRAQRYAMSEFNWETAAKTHRRIYERALS
jgi:glycosyltransferase involved in cell wall biosynthesis